MARGLSFAQVLDEKVAGHRTAEPETAPRFPFNPTIGFFCFDMPQVPAGVGVGGSGGVRGSGAYQAFVAPPRPSARPRPSAQPRRSAPPRPSAPPPRPRRTLTVREQEALETFIGLGAAIDADFTAETLRRAFRLLARRHHPDRHPGTTDRERTRHSAIFTQLYDAYRRLQPVASAA